MIVALLLVICVVSTTQAVVTHGTFSTRLDHFKAQDPRSFPINYSANLEHYAYGGPFYVYIKDSSDIQWIEQGLMVDIAANTSGALFTFDLRYFGTNIPTDTLSLTDLQYFETEQILADIATFIAFLNQLYQTENQHDVILYGRGYGGSMAVWARKKFPHLIDGAWSSSGVFEIALASLSVFDDLSYVFFIGDFWACRNNVQQIFRQLDALVTSGDSQRIQELLNLCNVPITDDINDVATLFYRHIAYLMRYLEENHLEGFNSFCETILEEGDGLLEAFGKWIDVIQGSECRDVSYSSLLAKLSDTDISGPGTILGERQQFYLQCAQTGLFQITDSITWLPNRIEFVFYAIACEDVFGPEFDAGLLRQANAGLFRAFGSLNQRVTNVIYTNGVLDPWMYNGITYSDINNEDVYIYNIENYSKSADFPSIQESDRPNLVAVKNAIFDRIVSWTIDPEIIPI